MRLQPLPFEVSVCKLRSLEEVKLDTDFCCITRTEKELSLVCKTADVPAGAEKRDDGWKGFYIDGILEFSLTGILSGISTILAGNGISIFAVSTYDSDYIFVKAKDFERALSLLSAKGYTVL